MGSSKLKNAPLKEVVFELQWALRTNDQGLPSDPGFDLAQGKFAERLFSSFPHHNRLYPENFPGAFFHLALNQYWAGPGKWPLVQHGMGMISVNDTDMNYEWSKFKPTVLMAINSIQDSYEDPLEFNLVKLAYIDAWDVPDGKMVGFVKDNLQTEIINKYALPGEPTNFNISQLFDLGDNTRMRLNIRTGINNATKLRAIIWETIIELKASIAKEKIEPWLEESHETASNMFKQMLNPDFYVQLGG